MEREVRIAIKQALDKCDSAKTPKVCALKSTQKGYLKVESDILSMMLKNNFTPSEAIAHVENYLNDVV